MADPNSSTEALLTEHFRYTPLSLIDDIINTINTIIYRALEAIENGLLSTPPSALGFSQDPSSSSSPPRPSSSTDPLASYPHARTEIEHGVHQLETLLEATVDKTFDKFEIYLLRNILTVPDGLTNWMRLAHYENLPLPNTTTTDPNSSTPTPTPSSILSLRAQLLETRKLHHALSHEHARTTSLLASLRSLIPPSQPSSTSNDPSAPSPSPFAFLTTTPSAQKLGLTFSPPPPPPPPSSTTSQPQSQSQSQLHDGPLTQHARFSTAQLPELRALVRELRPWVGEMRGRKGGEGGGDGEGDERRRYIEERSRGVVERVGVAEASGGGGDGGGERRRVEGAEVRDLEGMEWGS